MEKQEINTIPSLTWNWLKMNKDSVEISADFNQVNGEIENIPAGFKVSSTEVKSSENFGTGICNKKNPKQLDGRYEYSEEEKSKYEVNKNHQILDLINSTAKKAQLIEVEGNSEKPLILNFTSDAANQIADNFIHAAKDTESTVILVYKSSAQTQIIRTRILAEENATIHLVKVQLNSNETLQLDDTAFVCNDSAKAIFTQIELGGKHTDSGLNVNLNGYKSEFKSNIAYLCQNEQYLDMNHIVNHFGKKTECDMQVNGSLKDNSTKVYRGTIDFKNGCCGSKGNEMEETLLLNPKVVNKSLPVILCDEEDVEGEHGATIGRLSNDILFYMESRGISEEEAEKIMSIAKIQAVSDLIPDEKVKEAISNFLDK